MIRARAIEWKRRRRHTTGLVAEYWLLESICGRWRIVESRSLFGLPTVIRVLRLEQIDTPDGSHNSWRIVSTHRKSDRAKAACDRAARGQV